jgi:hypothetical protein
MCIFFFFSIKHKWSSFPELVEKYLGCRVHVFDPAVDYIDHYYSHRNVRFFNARLSDVDQPAQNDVPGEKGWKHRRFVTLMKELNLMNVSIYSIFRVTELRLGFHP